MGAKAEGMRAPLSIVYVLCWTGLDHGQDWGPAALSRNRVCIRDLSNCRGAGSGSCGRMVLRVAQDGCCGGPASARVLVDRGDFFGAGGVGYELGMGSVTSGIRSGSDRERLSECTHPEHPMRSQRDVGRAMSAGFLGASKRTHSPLAFGYCKSIAATGREQFPERRHHSVRVAACRFEGDLP